MKKLKKFKPIPPAGPHKHKMRKSSWSAKTISFRCMVRGCQHEIQRPMNKREKQAWRNYWKRSNQESDKMHRCWRSFAREFMTDRGQFKPDRQGWELMSAVEKWAKKWKGDAIRAGCDDAHHASSDVWFILHRIKRRLWGTSVVVLTQGDGQAPFTFFLYPNHVFHMIKVLKYLDGHAAWDSIARYMKKARKKKKWQKLHL